MPHMLDANARILAIETSSRWGSAALGGADGPLSTGEIAEPMGHAREFAALVQTLLNRQGWTMAMITHVFVSVGPGSFTGLRIGVTLARTLSWSIGARIVAVPTLDALARNALKATPRPPRVAALLDAKRGQVYAAAYDLSTNSPQRILGPVLQRPAEFMSDLPTPLAVLGEGIGFHRAAIDATGARILDEPLWRPDARQVFALGLELAHGDAYTPGPDLLPLYIRRPEAEEKWEKLHPTTG